MKKKFWKKNFEKKITVVIRQNILFLLYRTNFFYLCNNKVRISVTITVKTQLIDQKCH